MQRPGASLRSVWEYPDGTKIDTAGTAAKAALLDHLISSLDAQGLRVLEGAIAEARLSAAGRVVVRRAVSERLRAMDGGPPGHAVAAAEGVQEYLRQVREAAARPQDKREEEGPSPPV